MGVTEWAVERVCEPYRRQMGKYKPEDIWKCVSWFEQEEIRNEYEVIAQTFLTELKRALCQNDKEGLVHTYKAPRLKEAPSLVRKLLDKSRSGNERVHVYAPNSMKNVNDLGSYLCAGPKGEARKGPISVSGANYEVMREGITDLVGFRVILRKRSDWMAVADAIEGICEGSPFRATEGIWYHRKDLDRERHKADRWAKDKAWRKAKSKPGDKDYTRVHYVIGCNRLSFRRWINKLCTAKRDAICVNRQDDLAAETLAEGSQLGQVRNSDKCRIVFFEIQIGSLLEESQAELDHKIAYKGDASHVAMQQLSLMKKLTQVAEDIGEPLEIKTDEERPIPWKEQRKWERSGRWAMVYSEDLRREKKTSKEAEGKGHGTGGEGDRRKSPTDRVYVGKERDHVTYYVPESVGRETIENAKALAKELQDGEYDKEDGEGGGMSRSGNGNGQVKCVSPHVEAPAFFSLVFVKEAIVGFKTNGDLDVMEDVAIMEVEAHKPAEERQNLLLGKKQTKVVRHFFDVCELNSVKLEP